MIRIALGLIVVTACSVDGPASQAGTGTGTLLVAGTLSASSGISGSADPTSFTTDLAIDVTRAGVPVTTGTVSISSSGGSVALVFDTTAMHWHGAQAGYDGTYTLDVTSDADSVAGVRVVGPDIQTFTAPLGGATVDSTLPLVIEWARAETAPDTTLSTRSINSVAITDTGSYSLAAGTLRSKPDQVENERLELVRAEQIEPAGGAAGSLLRVSVTTAIDLLVKPTN